MQPIASTHLPVGDEWVYEVKYDGFRCVLIWEIDHIQLLSRNNHNLTQQFPEVIRFCQRNQSRVESLLPVILDGELVVLNNAFQANFSWIRKRSRLNKQSSIQQAATTRPSTLLAFDFLKHQGVDIKGINYDDRKALLKAFITQLADNRDSKNRIALVNTYTCPKSLLKAFITQLRDNRDSKNRIELVNTYTCPKSLQSLIFNHKGEGIITKRKKSAYQTGKRHHDWFKIKNWRTFAGFLTTYHPRNDYFTVAVFNKNTIQEVGTCKHGTDTDAVETLQQFFMTKGTKQGEHYSLPPAICAQIHTLDRYKNELRE